MDRRKLIENPYRPGAGHTPPFLAGRTVEQEHFRRLLRQNFSTSNILITGLRGVGKTVLLENLRQMAEQEGWIWVGNDLSESSSLSEERLALRILTDVSEALGRVLAKSENGQSPAGHHDAGETNSPYAFEVLRNMYERSPGLPSDRLKATLVRLGSLVNRAKARGMVFAYDEAQCLSDHAERNEYPMSLLIETVASLQKREGVSQCLLVLSGLPQVFDALTDTRTYTERMFHVMTLERLSRADTLAAIYNPLKELMPPLNASSGLVNKVADLTGGYPYLIQFFGKELVDHLLRNGGVLHEDDFPSAEVLDRLDAGLFAARWNKTTDKQREVLKVIAKRPDSGSMDFSAQEISALSGDIHGLSNPQISQMLQTLCERGLLYRSRHGRYAFTVPMSETMILRRSQSGQDVEASWHGSVQRTASSIPAPQAVQPQPAASSEQKKNTRWGWLR
ncbi:MAG: AAA family ATPase [Hyphomicrobium sp.]